MTQEEADLALHFGTVRRAAHACRVVCVLLLSTLFAKEGATCDARKTVIGKRILRK